MALFLCNFAYGDKYIKVQEKQRELLKPYFVDIFEYGESFLHSSGYYGRNRNVIESSETGRGYCGWKPLIILDAMSRVQVNDLIVYSDVADEIYNPGEFRNWVTIRTNQLGGKLFGLNMYIHKDWTKRDCFKLMNCDEPEFWYHQHLEAGTIGLLKQADTIGLLKEWLRWNQVSNVIDKSPNTLGENLPGFIDHRTDQSILTNLVISRGWECEYTYNFKSYIHYNEFEKDMGLVKHQYGNK